MHQVVCNKCGATIERDKNTTMSVNIPKKSANANPTMFDVDFCPTCSEDFLKSLKHAPK